jgi:hypothetical protein
MVCTKAQCIQHVLGLSRQTSQLTGLRQAVNQAQAGFDSPAGLSLVRRDLAVAELSI